MSEGARGPCRCVSPEAVCSGLLLSRVPLWSHDAARVGKAWKHLSGGRTHLRRYCWLSWRDRAHLVTPEGTWSCLVCMITVY